MFKKIILPILFVLILLTLCSCDNSTNKGILPTKPFEIDNYYQSNMVLSQNRELSIHGKSEKGVQLTLSLFDSKGNKVKKTSTIAGDNDEFVLSFNSPKASNSLYKIIIDDSVNSVSFENILFGYVFLYLGDDSLFMESETTTDNHDANMFIVNLSDNNFVWQKAEMFNDLISKAMHGIYHALNLPIAFISGSFEDPYVDQFLSKESINNYKNIRKYLELINRSNDNLLPATKKSSYAYNTLIKRILDVKIDSIIWQQGYSEVTKFSDIKLTQLSSLYNYCLNHLFTYLNNIFDCNIYTIQNGYDDFLDISNLRILQSNPSFNMSNVILIPTYDCYKEGVIEEEALVNRISEMIYTNQFTKLKLHALSLSDVISFNHTITLSFYGTGTLKDVEIFGLEIINNNGEKLNFSYNFLETNLEIVIDEEYFDNGETLNIEIRYGLNEDIYNDNLLSTEDLPVTPFRVSVVL